MSEGRRTSPRSNAFLLGTLSSGPEAGTIECMIWDLSPDGAMIEVTDLDAVPDRLSLILPDETEPRSATVVWRSGKRLGLSF